MVSAKAPLHWASASSEDASIAVYYTRLAPNSQVEALMVLPWVCTNASNTKGLLSAK